MPRQPTALDLWRHEWVLMDGRMAGESLHGPIILILGKGLMPSSASEVKKKASVFSGLLWYLGNVLWRKCLNIKELPTRYSHISQAALPGGGPVEYRQLCQPRGPSNKATETPRITAHRTRFRTGKTRKPPTLSGSTAKTGSPPWPAPPTTGAGIPNQGPSWPQTPRL